MTHTAMHSLGMVPYRLSLPTTSCSVILRALSAVGDLTKAGPFPELYIVQSRICYHFSVIYTALGVVLLNSHPFYHAHVCGDVKRCRNTTRKYLQLTSSYS
jgi:hypothetical protein